MWVLAELDPGSVEYHVSVGWGLPVGVDVGLLGVALVGLVERHEVLRTRLVVVEGVVYQRVDPPPEPGSGVGLRVFGGVEELAEWSVEPFVVGSGPLWRVAVAGIGSEGGGVLGLVLHHVIVDAVSVWVLRRDLVVLYEAARRGVVPVLPVLEVQYADWAVWQERVLAGRREGLLGYWRAQLAGLVVVEVPTDRPRPPVRDPAGAVVPFGWDAQLVGAVRAVARRFQVSSFMVLLAAVQALLARYSGQSDIAVGVPVSGRGHPKVQDVVGLFINTIVLRTDLSGQPTFAELLHRVRTTALGGYAHQDLPFQHLVEDLNPPRDPARTPLFQILVNHTT
ncbi:condensation domain-containing protein, partial [Virgisporangium aurantiacum]|uniref:condensation domain-containing protein n=1 Tax=Virgisporangium aurantiacum TaxID=175570 RepID=UPI0023B2586C